MKLAAPTKTVAASKSKRKSKGKEARLPTQAEVLK
jgi:hypothetical protein